MKLLVAEDQSMLRDALCQLLLMEDDVEEIYQAADVQEAIELLGKQTVDVAILDIEMPIKRSGYFKRALAAHVDAYVLKDRSASELMATIYTVLSGQREYSPELVEEVTFDSNPLSEREQEVLQLVAKGASNQTIAEQLFLSNGTIRNYMTAIFNKLNANNRTDAVRIARENGWF